MTRASRNRLRRYLRAIRRNAGAGPRQVKPGLRDGSLVAWLAAVDAMEAL